MRDTNLIVVQAFDREWEAEMAKSALKSAGIDAMIQADSVAGAHPDLAWVTGGFKVLVREEDAAAARDVLGPPAKRA